MEKLITCGELAKRLNLTPGTIRRWARAGIIPCLKLSSKVVRFDTDEVESALRQRSLDATGSKSTGKEDLKPNEDG